MKDTSQVQNAEDLMVLYEELTFLVSQLNNDAPKIKKMYASLEQTIAQQETVAAKAAQTVEAAASDSVAKMQQESKQVLDVATQYLAKAESIVKRCETALSQMESLAKNIQSVREYQMAVDKRLALFEEKIQTSNKATTNLYNNGTSATPHKFADSNKGQAQYAKDLFPVDAMKFTFSDIKSVRYTKPYGIAIAGKTINAEHWTNLLEDVITYSFENYGIKKDLLCTADLGIHFPKTEYSEAHTVPYFAKRAPSNTNYKYRRMQDLGISVISEGADITVDVLKALLCDYLKITPSNIELFYHKK